MSHKQLITTTCVKRIKHFNLDCTPEAKLGLTLLYTSFMWNDKNCGCGYIKGHAVPTVAFRLMKRNGRAREKNRWKRWYKGKSTKRGKLREMAKKQFRFWTNIKYCAPCQHVNFISYIEASSGRSK
jgi:hypothetical protein